jgi:mRNA interferase HicA
MKRRELEERLKRLGWWFVRHGARHDLWTNGVDVEAIPRLFRGMSKSTKSQQEKS